MNRRTTAIAAVCYLVGRMVGLFTPPLL